MLVRASIHTCGLSPGQTGDLNGNDPAVRASLAAGYLERVSDDAAAPAFAVTQTDDDPEPPAEDDAEGNPDQDD